MTIGRYTFRFEGTAERQGPNFRAIRGTFDVAKDGVSFEKLQPEKRVYASQRSMPMTEAAIDSGIFGDLYVSLGEALEGQAWAVRVYRKPFITWIWFGCIIMALGGGLALSDRRYRLARREQALPAGAAAAR